MNNNKIHTPKGVKDLLPPDCTYKLNIERQLEAIFNKYGYKNIETPTFEYYEVFSQETGSISPEQMYKFFDRDGSILTLRADMTPPIARVAATAYKNEDLPLRFCYIGNAFRYNENYQGKLREFSQAGIELIGINSAEADAEVIAIAINSILNIGTGFSDNFRLDIGQVDFFNGLLEEAGFDENTSIEVQNMIAKKDYIGLEEIIGETQICPNIKTLFLDLPKLVGSIEILDSTRNLIKNEKALKALDHLNDIYNILKDYKLEKYISFDLGMITHLNYYTGIIFRGYTYGTGFSIIDGGRYDNLIKEFGADIPAVGFAIKIDEILNVIEHSQTIEFESDIESILLSYTKKSRKAALALADSLRRLDMNVENSLIGDDINKNLKYAKSKNIDFIVHFVENDKLEIIELQTGNIKFTNVDSLLSYIK